MTVPRGEGSIFSNPNHQLAIAVQPVACTDTEKGSTMGSSRLKIMVVYNEIVIFLLVMFLFCSPCVAKKNPGLTDSTMHPIGWK